MLEKLGVSSNNILPLPNVIIDDPYLALFNTRTDPGTPPQAAPDYVLNPLSIYRMARNEIPERHAPENIIPPALAPRSSSRIAERWADTVLDKPDGTQALESLGEAPNHDENDGMMPEEIYTAMDGLDPNLDMFFAPDQDMDWLAADGAVIGTGMEGEGLLPWLGTTQIGEQQFE